MGCILLISIFSVIIYQVKQPKALESITFFPIAPDTDFSSAETKIKLVDKDRILWRIHSALDKRAYLRQDAGFLFSNGRLIERLGNWKQNINTLTQEKKIPVKENMFLEAITFHYAELHEKGGQIFSAQALSQDSLYVIKEHPGIYISFHTPKTTEQNTWKDQLDDQTEQMLRYSWNKGIRHYGIHLKNYEAYPLNDFSQKAKEGFSGFTKENAAKMIGRLWEGLYKNYFLGITKQDGTKVASTGSTIPLILLAKDKTHLLVLTETANGESILLRQNLGTG